MVSPIPDDTSFARHETAWLTRACIYRVPGVDEIAPGQASPANEPGESSFKQLRERLPAISQLGATVVWLSPNPALRTPDIIDRDGFEELVQAAHAHGLRVIIQLDNAHLQTHEPASDIVRLWVDRGVDGLVFNSIPDHAYDDWIELRRELRSTNPEVVLIADLGSDVDTLPPSSGWFDGALDHAFAEQIRAFMSLDTGSAAGFWRYLEQQPHLPSAGSTRVTFLDHEMVSVLRDDTERLKLACMLHLTLPSTALISAEIEIGPHQSSRTTDRDVLEFYRSILFWRNKHGVSQLHPTLVYAGDDGTLIYRVGPWLILLNRSDDEIEIDLGSSGSLWLMLATSNAVRLHGSRLVLSRYGGAILGNERAR